MLLKKLSEAAGPSGHEQEVRNIIRDQVSHYVDRVWTDALGNLLTYNGSTAKRPRVMISAHMDEVGLMITFIEKNGFLRFKPLGSVDPRVLVAKPVLVGPAKVPGVIGAKAIHLQEQEERKKALKFTDLYIDIGTNSKDESHKLVKLGDYAVFATKFDQLSPGTVKGKAFDDRAGCLIVAEALTQDYAFPLYGAFTVQEEVGLRGATVAAYQIEPDVALVLECTTASDVPDMEEHRHATTLRQGPALTIMDMSVIASKPILKHLLHLAEKYGIPVQFRRATTGGTDAGRIHLAKGGVPTAVVSVPCRYIHSPVSVLSLDDLEWTKKLVRTFLKSIEEGDLAL